MRTVGITGGIASGKTSVCRMLKNLGAQVVFTDQVVHALLVPDTNIGKRILKIVGADVVEDGKFNREKIAKRVFNSPDLLFQLEEVLHPEVYQELERKIQETLNKTPLPSLFVVEVPLLFEVGFDRLFDKTVVVVADEKLRNRRCNLIKQADFEKRSSRHLTQEEKMQRADYILDNNGTLEELFVKTSNLYHQLTNY